jgi:hypothetical protein
MPLRAIDMICRESDAKVVHAAGKHTSLFVVGTLFVWPPTQQGPYLTHSQKESVSRTSLLPGRRLSLLHVAWSSLE